MKLPVILALSCVSLLAAADKAPDAHSLPAPPSVALNVAPLQESDDVRVLVNVIPATAKYVIFADLKSERTSLDPSEADKVGAGLSQTFEELRNVARERGANLIVVLGSERGIAVPLRQAAQPLVLRPNDPSVTVILFQWDEAHPPSQAELGVRFTTHVPASVAGTSSRYTISLARDTTGQPKSAWVYTNISRFVADAVKGGFDTVAVSSTTDPKFDTVWLPGCDDPVRISLTKPELNVLLYKRP